MIVVKSEKLPAIFLSTTDKSVSYKLNVYDNNNLITGRGVGREGGGKFFGPQLTLILNNFFFQKTYKTSTFITSLTFT